MPNQLTPNELPDSHIEFAKEIAQAARKHGMDKFTLEYQPKFDIDNPALTFWGKLKVVFSAVDGRGRPANNLKITYDTNLEYTVSSTPESSN